MKPDEKRDDTGRLSLTVVFITLNEAFHIGAAIDNIRDIAEDVIVVDSGSKDGTVGIAKSKGARVVHHKFENFGAQWNYALSLPIKTKWTMKMDPDERLSDELKAEIRKNLSHDTPYAGFSMRWLIHFLGKPVLCKTHWFLRIWRTGTCRFSDVIVNEHPIVSGETKKLKGALLHYDTRDLHAWVEKQNRYTSMEALMRYRGDARSARPRLFGTSMERRVWLSNIFWRVPGRYQILFFMRFVMQGAWRSGVHGWRWAVMRCMVGRLIEYKWKEMMHADEQSAGYGLQNRAEFSVGGGVIN